MALFLPFRALRYDMSRSDRAALLAPPYDVISPEQRRSLARHPENLVHLELPEEPSRGPDGYAAAAERLASWCRAGTLRRDPEPVLYAYAQRFQHEGRSRERIR